MALIPNSQELVCAMVLPSNPPEITFGATERCSPFLMMLQPSTAKLGVLSGWERHTPSPPSITVTLTN